MSKCHNKVTKYMYKHSKSLSCLKNNHFPSYFSDDSGKKSRRGRRKGAKNRLKLDPDTGQLVRTLIKRPRKQSPSSKKSRPTITSSVMSGASTSNITSNPSTHHSHPTLASVSAEESILLTDPASLWSAAMASWPPVTVAPPTFSSI